MMDCEIDVGAQFTRFPGGRFIKDGPGSGELFREDVLLPRLAKCPNRVKVILDNTFGYGSSFLEEAFGGIIRLHKGWRAETLIAQLELVTSDEKLVQEIQLYIREAVKQ